MKNNKGKIFYTIFIIASQTCNYSYTLNENVGLNAGATAVDKLEKAADRLVEKSLPVLSEAAPALGRELGREFGVESLKIISGLTKENLPAAKEVAQSVGENAGLASTTAIIAAGTAAAPYVAGAVTAYYVTKAGTYVYYQYYPTPEQIAQMERHNAEAEQHKAHAEEHKIAATQAREKQEALMVKAAFRNCLKNNLNSERNTIGIPSACASTLHAYAMAASGEQVDRDVETFKKYSPQGT